MTIHVGVWIFPSKTSWKIIWPSDWQTNIAIHIATPLALLKCNCPVCLCCCLIQMITVNALLFPSSVTNSLIAVGNDGLHERDRMVRACIAIVCELCEYKQTAHTHTPQTHTPRAHSQPDVSSVTVLAELCVAPLFCSLEEPCCGGTAGRTQHHS